MPKCPVCCRTFKDGRTLNLHFEQSHDSDDAVCEFCGDSCDDPRFRKRAGCRTNETFPSSVDIEGSSYIRPESIKTDFIIRKDNYTSKRSTIRVASDKNETINNGDKKFANDRRKRTTPSEPSSDVLELIKTKYPKILPKRTPVVSSSVGEKVGFHPNRRETKPSDGRSVNSPYPSSTALTAANADQSCCNDDFAVDVAELEVSTCEEVETVGVSSNTVVDVSERVADVDNAKHHLPEKRQGDEETANSPPRLERISPLTGGGDSDLKMNIISNKPEDHQKLTFSTSNVTSSAPIILLAGGQQQQPVIFVAPTLQQPLQVGEAGTSYFVLALQRL